MVLSRVGKAWESLGGGTQQMYNSEAEKAQVDKKDGVSVV
jgi:hypothetical protein